MVGDRSFDVVGAHANGLPAIGVTGASAPPRAAGRRALIDPPDELPAAVADLLGE